MNPRDDIPQSSFKNLSLKRDKQAFRMSTAAFSTAQTINRGRQNIENYDQQNNRETVRNRQQNERKSERKSATKSRRYSNNFPKLEQSPIFKNLIKLVNQERQYNKDSNKLQNHRTHCYASFSSIGSQQNLRYKTSQQQNFPPKIVKQLYDRQMAQSQFGEINYHFGNLQKSGYLYFSIQKTLILISTLNYVDFYHIQQPITINLPEHAISISQLKISELEVQNIQRHPFGQRQLIFIIWFQWQVGFYAFQPTGLIKIVDLNMKHRTSCQSAIYFDYCKKGNIYYMNQVGEIGKINIFHQNSFNIFNWGRKYSIRQYFYKFSHDTKRKKQKLIDPSIFKRAKQLYFDALYYFSEKKTKGISLICDRERDLLYSLVQTSIKQQNKTLSNEPHRQIRMYKLSQNKNLNILQKLQSEFYNNPPHLIKQLTQQKLYTQIGAHLFNNLPITKFKIIGIYIPHYFDVAIEYYAHNKTNIIVLLSNGSRLYLYVNQNNLILNQMINLPNLDELSHFQRIYDTNIKSITLTQKQPTGFKVIKHKLNLYDKSFAIIGVYKKNIMALLFTQMLGEQNKNQQEVQLLWQQSLQYDSKGGLTNSVFINNADFQIFLSTEFQNNLCKKKLAQYKYNQYQIIGKTQNVPQSKIKHKNDKLERIKINTIKQTPQSRQILHFPQQYLMLNKQKIKGVTKLRPIDTVLSTLYISLKNLNQSNIQSLLQSQHQLNKVYKKIQQNLKINEYEHRQNIKNQKLQVLIMLIQIYCDIDGIYYIQNKFNILNNKNYRESGSNMLNNNQQRRSSTSVRNDSFITVNTNRISEQSIRMSNNNNSNNYEQKVNNEQQKKRKIQKNILNLSLKYDYNDLHKSGITKNNIHPKYSRQNQLNSKQQWNQSILKLVIKLINFIAKQSINDKIKGYYNEIQKNNQWIDSSIKVPQNYQNSGQIQLGMLTYLARIIVPLWMLKLKNIDNFVYQYIIDICSKLLQLLNSLEQLRSSSHTHNYSQLSSLFTNTIQYNTMLHQITNTPNMQYGQGLGSEKQKFQQPIFTSLQKQINISNTVNRWRELIPNYFNMNLYKAIKLQAEINIINNKEDRKDAVINNYKLMPSYLLYCYYRDGTLTKSQIQILLEMNNGDNQNNIKNANHLIITDSMDSYEKVQYAIKQIAKTQKNLQQKQFLITYALQHVNTIRSLSQQQILKKKKQLQTLNKIIKLQQYIYKHILKFQRNHPDQPQNVEGKNLVNFHILVPHQVKRLIKSLKNPMLQLLYYCNFWDAEANFEQYLKDLMYDSKGNYIKSSQMRQKLVQIFQFSSQKSGRQKLPIKTLLQILNQLAYSQIEQGQLVWVVQYNDEKFMKQKLWVPLFLCQWGWSQHTILDHYIELANNHYKPYELLSSLKLFMYYWLSAYTLVKFRYVEGRRMLQISNQKILKINDNRSDRKIDRNVELLVNFLREKLAIY